MTISVCYIPTGDPRQTALAVADWPHWVPAPTQGPAVVLYSDVLNETSVYPDDGTLTSSAWTSDPLYAKDSRATAVANANTAIQSLIALLSPGLAQAQTDAQTCAASSDPLAPILERVVNSVATLAQGLADTLIALELIEPLS